MKFKTAVRRSTVILVILVSAVLIGYGYQIFGEILDRRNHPREFSEYVETYASAYGVPEYILYAVISVESGFRSNHVSDDGRIGLFQISPAMLDWLNGITKENLGHGILYDPETNIRCGAYILSYLYTDNGSWPQTIAVYEAGQAAVDEWMANPEYTDDTGALKTPDEALNAKISRIMTSADLYRELYY